MYEIEFYKTQNGDSDILDYIEYLQKCNNKDIRIKAKKVTTYIDLLSKYGFSLNEPYVKKIDDEIWELRPLNDRLLFASVYSNIIIILSVFTKRTRKTPKAEIDKAKRYLLDYKKRSEYCEKI